MGTPQTDVSVNEDQVSERAIGHNQVYFPGGILVGLPNTVVLIKGELRTGATGYIRGTTKSQLVDGRERTFFEGYASGPPGPGPIPWNPGDRLWNNNPDSSEWMGWVCMAAGTPGTWEGFGAIGGGGTPPR
jgi:hypothetical protein